MRVPIFQVDAFTTRRFAGNPAAVMPLDGFLSDEVLQNIAAENNLAETAFLVPREGDYALRWFTPSVEVPLCGHATLASAAVVMQRLEPERRTVVFHTASGALSVSRTDTGYVMDFPARPTSAILAPPALMAALGATALEVEAEAHNYLVLLPDPPTLRGLAPDFAALAKLERSGVIVTARDGGQPYDFISRYFAPAKGIAEDPVTGSAHCSLVPFWAKRLGKTSLHAYQASARGGALQCRLRGDRVELAGSCVFYLEGTVEI
jgi:PhzF family phenazine biosynthesis protein